MFVVLVVVLCICPRGRWGLVAGEGVDGCSTHTHTRIYTPTHPHTHTHFPCPCPSTTRKTPTNPPLQKKAEAKAAKAAQEDRERRHRRHHHKRRDEEEDEQVVGRLPSVFCLLVWTGVMRTFLTGPGLPSVGLELHHAHTSLTGPGIPISRLTAHFAQPNPPTVVMIRTRRSIHLPTHPL